MIRSLYSKTVFQRLKNCKRLYSHQSNNATININESFVNRNPRNLEMIGVANKPEGWELQFPSKQYWHKCQFQKIGQHTTASIVHNSGEVIVGASTREEFINKHLYSNTDVSAATNIGRVLALRCLQMGLEEVFFDTLETPISGETLLSFCAAMEEGGVQLNERPVTEAPEQLGIDYDSLTESEKRSLYPSLIDELRTTPDWGNHVTYPYRMRPDSGYNTKKQRYMSVTKVRKGMWWDRFYSRMSYPEKRPHWMPEPPTVKSVEKKEDDS